MIVVRRALPESLLFRPSADGEGEALDISDIPARITALEAKIEQLFDRQAITDVYRRYTRGLNRYDLLLLRAAFWEDAKIRYGPTTFSRDEWIKFWSENRFLKGRACQAHHITNETIDIESDRAHVESYLIAFWRPPLDSEAGLIVAGRYLDRVDRRVGDWRIAAREFIPHFWSEVRSVFGKQFNGHSWPESALGRCDKSDPCYRRPLSFP